MSLINEALKKAQTQRTGSAMDAPPMPGGGGGRGRQGMPKGTVWLMVAGAALVVVISVAATVYFVNRAPEKVAAAAPTVPAPVVVPPAAATVAVTVPAPTTVAIAPLVIPTPPPVVELPTAPPPAVETDAAAAVTTPGAEPVVEGSLADRIAAYVDKVRVGGIRTSENGSKVLMNDKVYRLNDVVDRKLGLRLVKISADSLTFADVNNATYVKNF